MVDPRWSGQQIGLGDMRITNGRKRSRVIGWEAGAHALPKALWGWTYLVLFPTREPDMQTLLDSAQVTALSG
jgi:hypothetical protein